MTFVNPPFYNPHLTLINLLHCRIWNYAVIKVCRIFAIVICVNIQLRKIQIGRIDSKNDYLEFFIILCFIFFCKFPIIIGADKEVVSNNFIIRQEYAELTFVFCSFIIPEPFTWSFSTKTKFFDRIYIAGRRCMMN